jgi:hypothetical protein
LQKITLIGLAAERPQSLFDAQIGQILAYQFKIARRRKRDIVASSHRVHYRRPSLRKGEVEPAGPPQEPTSSATGGVWPPKIVKA